MLRRILTIMTVVSLLLCARVWAYPTLVLDPVGGAISGAPGSTIGWGFTLTNTTDYLVLTSAAFNPTSLEGVFTDFISNYSYPNGNMLVVGPDPENSTVSQGFNPVDHTGIGSFDISGLAVPGTVNGQIYLTYDLFNVSPNDPAFNPDTDLIGLSGQLTADASVTVWPPLDPPAPVPEPGTIVLLSAGLFGLSIFSKRQTWRNLCAKFTRV